MQVHIHMGNAQSNEKWVKRMSWEKIGQGIRSTMKLVILTQWHPSWRSTAGKRPWFWCKFSLSGASQKKKQGRGHPEFRSTRTCKARNVYRLRSEFVDERGTHFGLKTKLFSVVEKHLPYRGKTGREFGTWQRWCNAVNVLDATELHTLQWLVLCYVNFASISKKEVRWRGTKGERRNPMALEILARHLWRKEG